MKLVTVAQMRAIEKEADGRGFSYAQMMVNAGLGVAKWIQTICAADHECTITALVGSGNNGGDALVALTALVQEGWQTRAYIVGEREEKDPLLVHYEDVGGLTIFARQDPGYQQLAGWLDSSDVLLDGILGTGVRLPLSEKIAAVLDLVRSHPRNYRVVAVDCPSGVDCDSGEAAAQVIPADLTVCMEAVKVGLLKFPAYQLVGQIEVVALGLPENLESEQAIKRFVVDSDLVKSWLPARPNDAHKGTFGTAIIAAGSVRYCGAVYLAGEAAYRCGTGLVSLAVPKSVQPMLAGALPEAIWLPLPEQDGGISAEAEDLVAEQAAKSNALLLGSGWGLADSTRIFLVRLLSEGLVRKVSGKGLPALVIDADGLKLLSTIPNWHSKLPADTVLTPHPGEMAILTGKSIEEIQAQRLEMAESFARKWGQVVVLKGANTVTAAPDGRTAVIAVATSALAVAGTGDVLAGMITGLRAQGVPAFEAACAGAWIHAQAGLLAAKKYGSTVPVLARDILQALADVYQKFFREVSN